jgi:hypothetical protein
MNLNRQRPNVEEMQLYLFSRAVHPEFFVAVSTQRVERFGYTLHATITSTGHLLTWKHGNAVLTEAIASRQQELPRGRFLLRRRFHGVQRGKQQIGDDFNYQMSNQVEVLPPELFLHVHEELLRDGARRGMFHRFEADESGISPLGWISVEGCQDTLVIHTCHTFPANWTILKTQSLIERR